MPTNFCRRRWSAASLLAALFICCNSPAAQAGRTSENVTVVIDAGHGGHDRGGIPGQRIAEKVMTLDVAQRLRNVLEASGYHVVMTRDSDVFVPLGTRVAIANSYRNAIFVCVHFNATNRMGASGIETYFYSRGRTFGESRSAPPWLLRLEKDKYSGSARGMRFPHESNRRCVRANCFLPPETRRRNCSWGPRAQFRWRCAVHDAGGDE